ncbi:MAG: hypothetical protein Fur006_61760 [Coleofasciculaceae cyanobacterium]
MLQFSQNLINTYLACTAMTTTSTEAIQTQLLEILAQLRPEQQQQVLNFAASVRQQSLAQQWNAISDREAAALKAEFAEEDLALAEAVLTDYLPGLQQEDEA